MCSTPKPQTRSHTRRAIATAALFCLALNAVAADAPEKMVWRFKGNVPLGMQSVQLQPSKTVVTMLATAQSPDFEKMRLVTEGDKHIKITDAEGQAVSEMPRHISFRVTASARDRLDLEKPYTFPTKQPLNDFLLGLKFKVEVFRGMKMRTIQPAEVRIIGVPADQPYDERIYRAEFDMGETRVDDRIVLEVFDSMGERVMKFHLDML